MTNQMVGSNHIKELGTMAYHRALWCFMIIHVEQKNANKMEQPIIKKQRWLNLPKIPKKGCIFLLSPHVLPSPLTRRVTFFWVHPRLCCPTTGLCNKAHNTPGWRARTSITKQTSKNSRKMVMQNIKEWPFLILAEKVRRQHVTRLKCSRSWCAVLLSCCGFFLKTMFQINQFHGLQQTTNNLFDQSCPIFQGNLSFVFCVPLPFPPFKRRKETTNNQHSLTTSPIHISINWW